VRGHKDIAEILLANKANVNARDVDSDTPLHYAVQGCKDVVELLLANKAGINVLDNKHYTPYRWAWETGCINAAEFLRQHGGHE
jgi:ankyrin repeat protein